MRRRRRSGGIQFFHSVTNWRSFLPSCEFPIFLLEYHYTSDAGACSTYLSKSFWVEAAEEKTHGDEREREREKNKTSTKCGAESAACHDDEDGCRKAEIKRFFPLWPSCYLLLMVVVVMMMMEHPLAVNELPPKLEI